MYVLQEHIVYDIMNVTGGVGISAQGGPMWQLELYQTEDGRIPLDEFFDGLEAKLHAKVLRDIDLLEEFGTALTMPQARHLDGELWELRTKFSSNISRIIYFTRSRGRIILLSGFVKKSQKTPQSEMDRAKRYMEDWKQRNEK